MTLSSYDIDHFMDDVKDRFFPRTLIVSKKPGILEKIVRQTIKKLNDLVFSRRLYEFDITSNVIDLTEMTGSEGVTVDRILGIVPSNRLDDSINFYLQLNLRPFWTWNLLRRQQDFIEYIFATEVQHQLEKKFHNYNAGWFATGTKIIVNNRIFTGVGKCVVFFLPKFDFSSTADEWELYDEEEQFVCDYLEALVMEREGRAQTEMNIMNLDTNADTLLSDGKQMREDVVNEFRRKGFATVGTTF